jgi:hypothetical protein
VAAAQLQQVLWTKLMQGRLLLRLLRLLLLVSWRRWCCGVG